MFMETQGTLPDRSYKQRLDALEEGTRIRVVRAQFKRDVKAREASVVELLLADECPKDFVTMHVVTLLMAVPTLGRTKTRKILDRARISPSKTLGGMTVRQRTELASLLAPYDKRGGS